MQRIIYKGDSFLSIEETVGDMVNSMGLVTRECSNDSEQCDSATCDFVIEIRRKHYRTKSHYSRNK